MKTKCTIQELIFIDLLIGTEITKNFRARFSDQEIREAIKIGENKIKDRKWFVNDKYSKEFIDFTTALKLCKYANKEITINNTIFHYRDESEHGILLNILENDELQIDVISKGEYYVIVTQKIPAMLGNSQDITEDVIVADLMREALKKFTPHFHLTLVVDNKIKEMNIIRIVKEKIIEEDVIKNTFKQVNSKYLRTKILDCLGDNNG